ncbi:ATP-binding protein [Clostridium sp. D33t1_170424_F3]|uniref:AAA family ATPase n=1 Tax=Clostridium sp. D33t1_170424_F3 TaxID=2787099 RepID=UPI0018AA5473|nr:ATP-binding protein [Clostridium sp. D33t1_170424_F3]
MPEIILLCGPCGCGKTHYAQRLREQGGTAILSSDDLMLRLFDACIGPERHQDMLRRCKAFLLQQAEELYALGLTVVLDFGFWSRAEREETRSHFIAKGLPAKLVYLDAPYDVITRHLEIRNRAVERGELCAYHIDAEKRARFDSWFEAPGPEEIDEKIPITE